VCWVARIVTVRRQSQWVAHVFKGTGRVFWGVREVLAVVAEGDVVLYLGYEARVVHVFGKTANIRFVVPVRGMSRQLDMWLSALVPVAA